MPRRRPNRATALPPFASELPYETMLDPEAGIVLLKTPRSPKARFALGCAWQITPVNIECLEEEECLTLARHHEQLLRGLPIGSCVQTLMTIVPSTRFPAWEAARTHLPSSQVLEVQRAAIAAGLPHAAGTLRARLRSIPHLVTLRWPLTSSSPELFTILKTLLSLPQHQHRACHAQLCAQLAAAQQYFLGLRGSVEDTLSSLGHAVEPLDAVGLGQAIAQALDPLGTRSLPLILPEHALREQVLSCEAETMPGGWRFGTTDHQTGDFLEEYRHQMLSLHRVTYQTYPGMLSAPRAPKDTKPMALWDAWDKPMTVAINAGVVDPAVEENRLLQKSLIAAFQAKLSSKNRVIKENIDKLAEQHMLTGSQTGAGRLHIAVWSEPQDGQRGVEQVQRAARRVRMALGDEPTLGSTLFLQTLPLGCDWDYPPDWALNRTRRMPTLETLSHLLTLYGGTRGTKHPSIAFPNARGEGIGFTPFDNATNPHFNIIGTTGAGKTFMVGHFLNQILPLGAFAVVLDPLKNYRTLCEYYEGTLVELNPNMPIYINPFYGPLDTIHVSGIAAGLNEMASGGIDRLSWEEFNVLGGALQFFASYWAPERGEPILTNFADEVLKDGQFAPDDAQARELGRTIARKLGLFYGKGLFAGFVDGPNSFTLDNPLTLVEFGDLKNEHLQGILFFFLFQLVTRRFEDPRLRPLWKCIIGDELWKLLKYKASADVMEQVIRTYRNFRISAGFLSQRAADWESPVGQVIRGLAETNLFLRQGSGELPQVKKLFDLSDAEEDLFQYIEKHESFSSGFLRLPDKQGGIIRLVPDALLRLQMAQTPEMHDKRAQLAAMGSRPLRERIAEAGYV